jgi:HK97 family phage portal protein
MTQRPGLIAHAVRVLGGFFNRATAPATVTAGRRVFYGRTGSGVYIDADTAWRDATVWACITYLSRTPAQVPWRVMREDPVKGKVPAPTHPADRLLNKRPNPEMGALTFRQTLIQWALRFGNGYAEIEWDLRGAPFALWPIHPRRVEPKRDGAGRLFYRVWNETGGGYVDVDAADMLHIRGMGDGAVGMSVLEYAAESLGWAQATQLFGSTYFGEGMNPSGVIEVPTGMSPEAREILREELELLYRGPKGKRTAILDAGMKFNRLSTQPNDSQFIETRQHQVEEICRWFSVPPHKVMHLLRATFSNIEHQSIEVVVDSIAPWAKVLEEEADYKLFGRENRGGFYTKLFLQALMRGDSKSRAEFYKAMVGMGVMSINEVRELEDLNPIGPDGDVRFVPVNMQTLERAIRPPAPPEQLGHNGGPAMTPEDDGPPADAPDEEA